MDMRNFFISTFGTFIDIIIAFLAVKIFMTLINAKTNLLKSAQGKMQGLTDKTRQRLEASKFYQRKEIGRNQRKAERQRAAVESYSGAITYGDKPGQTSLWRRARAARLRQRAGGFSAEAQNRAYVGGLGQVEKLESQETKDAEFLLKRAGIQIPDDLAAIAEGSNAAAKARNLPISGAGNEALQRAAIRKIIGAQDAKALETLYKSATSDKNMLVQEVRDNYSTAKGAGAHIVKLNARQYNDNEIQDVALEQLATLSAAKLAGQDGPAVASALAAFTAGRGTPDQRDKFVKLARQIRDETTILGTVKDSARAPLKNLLTHIGDPTGGL